MIRRLVQAPAGALGTAIVLLVALAAAFAPWLAPYDPDQIAILDRFAGLSTAHWLGTDQLGRDLLSRLLYGATVAMAVSAIAIAIAAAAGTLLGVAAAAMGGWGERAVLILFDIVAAFPSLVLALAVVAVFGPGNGHLVGIVAVTLAPQFGRVARAQVLTLQAQPFLEAERILGASPIRILWHHILPNIAGPLIVLASMEVPSVITIEAGLSFIGLGVRPPTAEWGIMVAEGASFMVSGEWWIALFPGLALMIAVFCFNLLGDGLRDIVDPSRRT